MFGPYFKGSSWDRWRVFASMMDGVALSAGELEVFQHHTGRSVPPTCRIDEVVLINGRRAGKSFMLAMLAVYAATVPDYSERLAPGETPTVAIIAADRRQARVIFRYTRGLIVNVEATRSQLVAETQESLTLDNGVVIEVQVASYRSVRGYTLAGCFCDEVAFWRDEGAANPADEVLNAVRPALATLGGPLLIASTAYSKSGTLYKLFRDHWGKDDSATVVWRGTTPEMNPKFPDRVIQKALSDDPDRANAEYFSVFRADVSAFITREVIDAATVPDRYELPPIGGTTYFGFTDPSGGSSDSMTLGIAHRQGDLAVLDLVREVRPPFSPDAAVEQFAATLKSYRLHSVTGDRYAAGWPPESFQKHGIAYIPSDKTKTEIYANLLPLLNAGRAELLDLKPLSTQLSGLERRSLRGGRETIDHAQNMHDDVINAAAGALVMAGSGGGYIADGTWI